jgi:hypothetical protein
MIHCSIQLAVNMVGSAVIKKNYLKPCLSTTEAELVCYHSSESPRHKQSNLKYLSKSNNDIFNDLFDNLYPIAHYNNFIINIIFLNTIIL